MKHLAKHWFLFILIIVLFIIIFTFWIPIIPIYQGRNVRVTLLHKTNLPELLKAGRELINDAQSEEYITETGQKVRKLFLPKDIKIPKIINRLKSISFGLPCDITVESNGYLRIIFGERLTGVFGVNIYPDDFNEPYPNYEYGNKKLLQGLWYFDEFYQDSDPNYDKLIDSIIKTGKYP